MCCTFLPRVLPVVVRGLKFLAVQTFLPRPTPFRIFSASCHVYKSTVARLKLDINANNIVCFTGYHFLTGFGRDQAVKRCVTGPLIRSLHCLKAKCHNFQWNTENWESSWWQHCHGLSRPQLTVPPVTTIWAPWRLCIQCHSMSVQQSMKNGKRGVETQKLRNRKHFFFHCTRSLHCLTLMAKCKTAVTPVR